MSVTQAAIDDLKAQLQREREEREAILTDMRVWCCNATTARLLRNLVNNVAQLTAENASLRDRVAALEFAIHPRRR